MQFWVPSSPEYIQNNMGCKELNKTFTVKSSPSEQNKILLCLWNSPVLLPGEFHGQRSLVGYSPWSRKVLDTD